MPDYIIVKLPALICTKNMVIALSLVAGNPTTKDDILTLQVKKDGITLEKSHTINEFEDKIKIDKGSHIDIVYSYNIPENISIEYLLNGGITLYYKSANYNETRSINIPLSFVNRKTPIYTL